MFVHLKQFQRPGTSIPRVSSLLQERSNDHRLAEPAFSWGSSQFVSLVACSPKERNDQFIFMSISALLEKSAAAPLVSISHSAQLRNQLTDKSFRTSPCSSALINDGRRGRKVTRKHKKNRLEEKSAT